MNRIRYFMLLCLALLWDHSATGQSAYKLPPKDVVAILDAPPPPLGIVSPSRDNLLLIEIQPYPSIEVVAEPILRLAGLRINPRIGSLQRLVHYTGMSIQPLDGSPARRVALPQGSSIHGPEWSYDGKKIAFARDVEDGVDALGRRRSHRPVETDRRRAAQRRAGQTRSPGCPTIATSWLSSCPRGVVRRQPHRGPRLAPTCRKAPGT